MNSLEHYQQLVDGIFGAKSATFDTSRDSNNILGALARQNDYLMFRQNFVARLNRLNDASFDGHNRKALLEAVNELANPRNWDGAYAELAGLDFLLSSQNYGSELELNATLPAANSIAAEFGKTNTNLDVQLKELDTYLDIKCLSDKSASIINGIINSAVEKINLKNATIRPEYPLDLDYEIFAKNRQPLLNELVTHLSTDQKSVFLKSSIVDQLTFRISRRSTLITTSSYDPYAHAENQHKLVFQHIKKLLRNKPTLLLYVHFPWFSEQQITVFDSHEVFYRSLARRTFCQYGKDSNPLKDLLPTCQGNISTADAINNLSGIIFINDQSIKEGGFKSYTYLNPNASNKVSTFARYYLEGLGCAIDDFEHDNY